MPDLLVAEEVQAHLIAQGVVRDPAAAGGLPPCWIDPDEGAPEPPEGVQSTVTLFTAGQVVRPWLEGDKLQEIVLDVVVRSRHPRDGHLLQRQIYAALEEKKNVAFGALRIEWSKLFRGVQKLGSDHESQRTLQSFRIAARLKSLAGLPYAP